MSFIPLTTSLSSIRTINSQLDVVSGNIANANTEGYTKKTLDQYTNALGGEGRGVFTGVIERQMDAILQRDLFTQTAKAKSYEVKARYQDLIQNFHRPPDQDLSITSELARLEERFASLANEPNSSTLLDETYAQAEFVADKMNDFSQLISQMRNDAQDEAASVIAKVNNLLGQIATLNKSISQEQLQGRSTATLRDSRDQAVSALAEEIALDTFERSDGVLEVMTVRGTVLADKEPRDIIFNPEPIGPDMYYPNNVSGVFVDDETTGVDLAGQSALGGRLGALLDLRDRELPQYQAQMDELAHKTASRFSAAGLDLFTDADGNIPANNPVDYTGFSAEIQVNPAIQSDITLLRSGTTGASIDSGSSEFLRRVINNVFGDTAQTEALGNIDISGAGDLFTTLGIDREARYIGTTNIESLTDLVGDVPGILAGTSDTFNIQVGVAPAQDITINPGDTATDLVNTINGFFPGLAQIGPSGQLVLTTNDTITIGNTNMTGDGLDELGLELGTTNPVNPSFDLTVGVDDPITIPITPTDTGADLVNTINTLVPKVTASLDGSGFLQIVPNNGGEISITEGQSSPAAALGLTLTKVAHTAFNNTSLGPGGSINGGVSGASTLEEYSKLMVTKQSMDATNNTQKYEAELSYQQTIATQVQNISGVNLDEEMAALIQLQTSYSASTQVVETFNRMLDDLFLVV